MMAEQGLLVNDVDVSNVNKMKMGRSSETSMKYMVNMLPDDGTAATKDATVPCDGGGAVNASYDASGDTTLSDGGDVKVSSEDGKNEEVSLSGSKDMILSCSADGDVRMSGSSDLESSHNGSEMKQQDGKMCARKSRRVLHFSDGTLEYSSDEDEPDEPQQEQQPIVDPRTLSWGGWFVNRATVGGTSALAACDYVGENLAYFLGITAPKYHYEIREHYRAMKKEEEQRQKDAEAMVGWMSQNDGESKCPITTAATAPATTPHPTDQDATPRSLDEELTPRPQSCQVEVAVDQSAASAVADNVSLLLLQERLQRQLDEQRQVQQEVVQRY